MKRKKSTKAKKNRGKKMVEKAGMAIKYEFYLEAALILSSIFERKLGRLRGRLEPAEQLKSLTFDQLIKRVKYLLAGEKHPELTGQVRIGLIDEIRKWKNQRNGILKELPSIHVSRARLERLANAGIKLYKELNTAVKSVKSATVDPGAKR